jgi:hypothetical protein
MRRIFADVPVIYGFSASAPVGVAAAASLDRYFTSGAAEVGSGRRSGRLLAAFARSGMTATRGAGDARGERREICPFFDERTSAAQKLDWIHATMRRDMARTIAFVERIEGLLASLSDAERDSSDFVRALGAISADRTARQAYLAASRALVDPASRARRIALAAALGWLSPGERAAETVAMIDALLARAALGFGEVETVCSLNEDGRLDGERERISVPAARAGGVAAAAVRACLADRGVAREHTLRALSSADEGEVRVAQVYLRHRPALEPGELRTMVRNVLRMQGTAAQVRALDTLGRLRIDDRGLVDELARSFAAARSPRVQRAIAEVLLRSDARTIAAADFAGMLRRHRLAPGDGGDVIDELIRRLTPPAPS